MIGIIIITSNKQSIIKVFFLLLQYIHVAPDQVEILKGLAIPWCEGCDEQAIQQMVAIVGAVIMPHNLYLHSALVLVSQVLNTEQEQDFRGKDLQNVVLQKQQVEILNPEYTSNGHYKVHDKCIQHLCLICIHNLAFTRNLLERNQLLPCSHLTFRTKLVT